MSEETFKRRGRKSDKTTGGERGVKWRLFFPLMLVKIEDR